MGGELAGVQQGADAPRQAIRFIEAAGGSPLPRVVRTSAPVGQPSSLRAWRTRAPLSALSTLAPEGKLSAHGHDRAIPAATVRALLEHLRREEPGRLVSLWGEAPIPRCHLRKEVLARGAGPRLHVECLPA